MANPDEIRRETEDRERQRDNAQTAETREMGRNAIAALLVRLHELAHQIFGLREQSDLADARQKKWVSQHPEITQSKFSPAFLMSMSIVLLAVYPAVYLLDLFLLSGNAKHLAKDFANGNQILIYATIFLLPLVVLAFETGFQTQWAIAETRGQMWKWGIASVAMCFAVPATIIGFSMATTSNVGGARTAQVQNWQLLGKAALAFFAHFAILLGGKRLHEAKNYLIFKVRDKWLERRINRLTRQTRRNETDLVNAFNQYFQQRADFNAAYPQNQIEPGPFDETTRNEINQAFGYEIIAAPLNQNPPTDNNGGGTDGGTPNNTPPTNPINPANPNPNNQLNNFGFEMDGEDEVRP